MTTRIMSLRESRNLFSVLSLLLLFFLICLIDPSISQAVPCSNAPSIAAGETHTVGLKEDGTVVAVGRNYSGELNVSSWRNIKAIAAGTYHTVGLKEDGTVLAVGDNGSGQLNVSSWRNIKAIAADYAHTVGLKEDGTVVAVGWNRYGLLNVSSWTNVTAIAAGGYHTVGLKEDGTVVSVGAADAYFNFGQTNVSSWTNIKAIAAGGHHTVGLKEDGTVVAVGDNRNGQLNVSSWTNIKAIAAGAWYTVGLKEDGTVVAVGDNSSGQLNVSSWTNIKTVATGKRHTVGLKEDGTAVAAGWNLYGQSNVSSWKDIMKPVCLNAPPIAAAGPDQTVECASADGTPVILTGSGSSDPDGDTLTHTWTWDGVNASGTNPIIMLPLGVYTITLTADDGKGGVAQDTVVVTVRDTIQPVTVLRSIAGITGNNGWYRSDVTISVDSTDACSGIKEIAYSIDGAGAAAPGSAASFTVESDGGHAITYHAKDNAGNTETAHPITIKIDKTAPRITATASPAANANGWYNSDVMVTFTCNDTVSGIASCSGPVTVTAEGANQVITGTAVDNAGNTATTSVTLNIDKTAPSLSVAASPAMLWPPNHKMVTVTPSVVVTDANPGTTVTLLSVVSSEPDNGLGDGDTGNDIVINANGTISLRAERSGTGSGRVYTMTYKATDVAGNTSTTSTTVTVPHDMR